MKGDGGGAESRKETSTAETCRNTEDGDGNGIGVGDRD